MGSFEPHLVGALGNLINHPFDPCSAVLSCDGFLNCKNAVGDLTPRKEFLDNGYLPRMLGGHSYRSM